MGFQGKGGLGIAEPSVGAGNKLIGIDAIGIDGAMGHAVWARRALGPGIDSAWPLIGISAGVKNEAYLSGRQSAVFFNAALNLDPARVPGPHQTKVLFTAEHHLHWLSSFSC